MKRVLLLIVVFLLSGCASSPASAPQHIVEMPFPIAGGQILRLPVADGGPVPAENDRIKIQVAGFIIGPSTSNPAIPSLSWTFGFKTKTDQKIEQVMVEEVGASDSAKLMLVDDSPNLKQGAWAGKSEATKADKRSAPWLYSSKPSIFVFKFSIKMQGMPVQILYQPSWFPAAVKQAMAAGYGVMD
jgi:hypothetical protein